MLSNLTVKEIGAVVRNFRSVLDSESCPRSINDCRNAIHQLTDTALQAGRLVDTDLTCILDLVLAYNWLEDAVRDGAIVSIVNETYKHRPYTGDSMKALKSRFDMN
jgi:hypothetical protein